MPVCALVPSGRVTTGIEVPRVAELILARLSDIVTVVVRLNKQ